MYNLDKKDYPKIRTSIKYFNSTNEVWSEVSLLQLFNPERECCFNTELTLPGAHYHYSVQKHLWQNKHLMTTIDGNKGGHYNYMYLAVYCVSFCKCIFNFNYALIFDQVCNKANKLRHRKRFAFVEYLYCTLEDHKRYRRRPVIFISKFI